MPNCMRALLALVFLFTFLTAAASKKKPPLPPAILHARTAIVLIDPNAGILVNAPLANTTAQDDVEKAIMNWGRLRLAQTVAAADLVITVRKGNGKIVQKTIGGVPTNDRPIVVQPNDTGIHIGAQRAIRRISLKWIREIHLLGSKQRSDPRKTPLRSTRVDKGIRSISRFFGATKRRMHYIRQTFPLWLNSVKRLKKRKSSGKRRASHKTSWIRIKFEEPHRSFCRRAPHAWEFRLLDQPARENL